MTKNVPDILARIVSRKREELAESAVPLAELERWARLHDRRDFRAALESRTPAVIAEIKKASPSKGVLSPDFDPVRQARAYEQGGASALSILTDGPFFQGSLEHLGAARAATRLPVLRKDFTIDPYHVIEAAAHGADAILLIVAILDEARIREYASLAAEYGMAALVEVHDDGELDIALAAGASMIGVNNRDLHTFHVTLETSVRLAPRIPKGVLKVSESGIHSAADVRLLAEAGYQAFLVGEHLMKSGDASASLQALVGSA